MANVIDTRIIRLHCKSYEGDVHGFDSYQNVKVWDAESNNDFEENFLLEHYREVFPDLIVTIEDKDFRPYEYNETPDPTVRDLVYAPFTD